MLEYLRVLCHVGFFCFCGAGDPQQETEWASLPAQALPATAILSASFLALYSTAVLDEVALDDDELINV